MSTTRNTDSVEVVLKDQRRRRWSPAEKEALVRRTYEPGMSVSLVARQEGVAASLLFQWRKLERQGALTAVSAGEAVVPASELAAARAEIAKLQRALKFSLFGHDMVVLHEMDIRRKKGAFATLGKEAREQFMTDLTAVIDAADFTLIAVVIDKAAHARRYARPDHPYHLAFQFGLERLNRLLQSHGQGGRTTHVVCEARGAKEDAELELEFRRIRDGANFLHQRLPFELIIAHKQTNSEGLQLADLTARPIGLSVLRPGQLNRAYQVLERKFFRDNRGVMLGIGLKVFP